MPIAWTALVGALAVVVTAVCGPTSAVPIDTCGLQTDTAAKRQELSALNPLFGQLLTTESDGNVYCVSICHRVPQISYDPRQLVGAVKQSKDGYSIDLGFIDRSNVVVNDESIVLTYTGGDETRNPRDTCRGLRWSTYLTFICDPGLTVDILTLIDEDPNQTETCQISFEIRTSKTCNRQSNAVKSGQHTNEIGSETQKSQSNQIPFGNRFSSNDENGKVDTNNNTYDNRFEDNYSNHFNSQNISSSDKPPIIVNPNLVVYKNKSANDEKIEKSSNRNALEYISSNDRKKNNFISDKKSSNIQFDNKYLNEKTENTLSDSINTHLNKENKSTVYYEDKNSSFNQYISKSNLDNNKNSNFEKTESALNYNANKKNNLNRKNSQNENLEVEPSNDKLENSNKNQHKTNDYINSKSNQIVSDGISSKNEKNNVNQNDSPNKNSEGNPSRDEIKHLNNNTSKSNDYINPKSNQIISDKISFNDDINNLNRNNTLNENSEGKPSGDNVDNLDWNNTKTNSNPDQNSNHIISKGIVSNQETNSSNDDSKFPGKRIKGNNSNQTYLPNSYSDDSKTQNYNANSGYKNNTTFVINNKSNRSLQNGTSDDNTKNPSKSSNIEGTSTISNQNTNDANQINSSGGKNYNSNSDGNSTIVTVTTKPSENRISSRTFNDQTNQTGIIQISNTEKTADGSINNYTYDKSDLNTIKTQAGKSKSQSEQITTQSPAIGADLSNNNNDYNITATHSVSQLVANFYSKLFPHGIQLSAASIFGVLGSLSAVFVLVGAAINRYYHKRTGTDQIPFKGVFQCIYVYIKAFLAKICCCCGGNFGPLDFTNEKTPLLQPKMVSVPLFQDDILKQKAKTSGDDSTKKSSEDFGSDHSGGEKKTKTYGSMAQKSNSDPDNQSTLYDDKEKLFKTEHNLQGKSIKNTVNEYINMLVNVKLVPKIKSIFEKTERKFENIDETIKENADITPTSLISRLLEKGKSIVTKQNDTAHNDEVIKTESTDSHIIIDTSKKQSSGIEQNKDIVTRNDVEVKPSTDFDETKANDQMNTSSTRETSGTKSKTQNESQKNDDTAVPETKTINDDAGSEFSNLNDLIAGLQEFVDKNPEKSIDESTSEPKAKQENTNTFLINEKNEINKKQSNIKIPSILESEQTELIHNAPKSSNDTVLDIGTLKQNNENDTLNKSQNSTITPASETLHKTKASGLVFSGENDQHEEKNTNVQVELSDKSNVSEKKTKDDDDESTEIIEEIIYVDGVEGEEDEEIIEEITETTVVETPDADSETLPFSDSHKGPTTTTVRKTTTRKISSTSDPDEVTTVEETIVSGDSPEHEKSNLGFQIGIGTSGVNASVGNIDMGIGRSSKEFGKHEDVSIKLKNPENKWNRGKNKTDEKDEPGVDVFDERDVITKEKSKKSMTLPNLKMFKRSISQPTTPNIEEVIEDNAPLDVVSKKKGRSTSSLFKLGKSKSKSPEIIEKPDVNAGFLGHERRTSTITTVDQSALTELDGDEGVAVERKTSIASTDGKAKSPKKEKGEKKSSIKKL